MSESARARPASALRDIVASYDGYLQRGASTARHRGLPSPFLTLIFTLHEPLYIAEHVDGVRGIRPAGRYDALIGGLHTSPALITHDGAQSGIQVRLSPLGARALLGMPAGELTGICVHASDVLGRAAAEICQGLPSAAGWPERFAVLDRMLQRRLRAQREGSPKVTQAWRCLLRSGGSMPISELSEQVGWSNRHLENRFRTEIGLTPKVAARVIRFHRARQKLAARAAGTGTSTLASLAADTGYCDQSHLVREFTALAGCSPSRWLAEEFGNIQAKLPPHQEAWRHD